MGKVIASRHTRQLSSGTPSGAHFWLYAYSNSIVATFRTLPLLVHYCSFYNLVVAILIMQSSLTHPQHPCLSTGFLRPAAIRLGCRMFHEGNGMQHTGCLQSVPSLLGSAKLGGLRCEAIPYITRQTEGNEHAEVAQPLTIF